ERVEYRNGPCAHREYIPQYAAHARRRALVWLDERGGGVAFHLEDDAEAVAYVNDAGVFARALYDPIARRGELPKINPRALVRAVLGPHRAEYAYLRKVGLPAQSARDFIIFLFREPVFKGGLQAGHVQIVPSAINIPVYR